MKRTDVLTITPNPSLDLLHETDTIVWDDANRVAPPRRRAGGQGINVARAVLALGGSARVIALLGGGTGDGIAAMLERDGLPCHRVDVAGETRTFAAIRETGTGRSLLINPRGEPVGADCSDGLFAMTRQVLMEWRPRWVACCGSLPPGVEPDFYARVAALVHEAGARFVVDCDGEPLRQALAAGCDLLVPNRYEAERLTGLPVRNPREAAAAARLMVDRGVTTVAVTLGHDGAVLVTAGYATHARAREERSGSAVGAGDSFLASLLLSLEAGRAPDEALRRAVATGTAVLSSRGSDLVDTAALEALYASVELEEIP